MEWKTAVRRPGAHVIAGILVILVACCWAYAPAFHGGWLWDDDLLLTANPDVASEKGLLAIWLNPSTPDYFPLTMSAFWVERRFLGDDPSGYHGASILLHGLSALLLWRTVGLMRLRGGWLAGLVYAVHPVCVASVAWVAELKNTFSMPLFLLAVGAFVQWEDGRGGRHGRMALLFFLLAMLAKSSLVMFPVMAALYIWWRRGRLGWEDAWRLSPFFGVSLVLGLVTLYFQQRHAMGDEDVHLGGLVGRMSVAGPAAWHYLGSLFLPRSLMAIYPRWPVGFSWGTVVLPWAGLAGLVAVGWRLRAGVGRHVLMGVGFCLVMVLPVLGFVKMAYMRIGWVSDHFVYAPMVGPIVMVSAMAAHGCALMRGAGRHGLAALVAAGLAYLAISTRQMASVWSHEESLWTHNIRLNGDAWQAHNRLGAVLYARKDFDAALIHFQQALRVRPDLAEIHNNIGSVLMSQARHADAIPHLLNAASLAQERQAVRDNLVRTFLVAGNARLGQVHARILTERYPWDPVGFNNLGIMLRAGDQVEASRRAFRAALRLDPGFEEARKSLVLLDEEERAAATPPRPADAKNSPAPPAAPPAR